MSTKRYKPMFDKVFWFVWMPLIIYLLIMTVISLFEPYAIIVMVLTDLFCLFFMLSPFAGYVELRESSLYIRFGFILKREIAYNKIRELNKEKRFMTQSIPSLKNAMEHVNIKYNKYNIVAVSVIGNDELIEELNERIKLNK